MMIAVQELTADTLLGHYRIVRRLGRGGKGVVYEAEDQKLRRPVAIKVLLESTRQDPEAVERFWREARTASSLNHAGKRSGAQNQVPTKAAAAEQCAHNTIVDFAWSPSGNKLAYCNSARLQMWL